MPPIWDDITQKWKDVKDSSNEAAAPLGTTGLGWAEEAFKYGGKAASKFGKTMSSVASKMGKLGKITALAGTVGKFLGPVGGILSFWADRQKDMMIDAKLSGLANEIGEVKDGLNNLNSKVEAQGKALKGQIDNVKSELEGALKQQGAKFDQEIKVQDAKIAQLSGEQKKQAEAHKKALQQQKQELESQIKEVTANLTKAQTELKKELDDFKNEVNERFAQQEQKILDNKRKIEEEKAEREKETREIKDKIKLTNINLDNLKKEKDELKEDFQKHQFQTNQKLAETQAELADTKEELQSEIKLQKAKLETEIHDTREELEFQTTNLDIKISTTQEILQEQEEELAEVKYEQRKSAIQQQELVDQMQETNDILYQNQRKLNLVAQQMDDIQEEVHLRMDNLATKLEQRTNQTLKIAQETNQKVNQLTNEVQTIRQELTNLEEQVEKNKEETEKIKQQAKLTNERLANLLQSQTLSEEANLDKIQKSLELKNEETKLLATLNLLKETKKLVHAQSKDKEWLVGITKGTKTEKKSSEGLLLDPNSSWAKNYTPEQLAEWGWDGRLLGEHDQAQLTSEEKLESQQEKIQAQEQEGEEEISANEQAQEILEQVNEAQWKVLEQLQSIQTQIQEEIQAIEQSGSTPPPPKSSPAYEFKVISAQSKVELKKKKLKQAQTEEKAAQKQVKDKPTQKNQEFLAEAQQDTKQAEQELAKAEEQLHSLEKREEFEQDLEKYEENLQEEKQEEIIKQWQEIQALSQQVLQEQPPEEVKEEELDKKLEELVQQIQEMEAAQVASKKTMTKWMLFLIIFLIEYVVYKKNGVLGLIILNVILAIAYYKKDEIMKYYDLWEKYFLIIGYVLGNVMAYNSVENPQQKWPLVMAYNAIILGIYGYTYWEQQKEKVKLEAVFQQKTSQIRQENNITEEEWKTIENTSLPTNTFLGGYVDLDTPFNNNFAEIKTQQLTNLKEVIEAKEEIKKQEAYLQKQAETLEKTTKINEQLAQAQNSLNEVSEKMTWTKIKDRYPEFAQHSLLLKELKQADQILKTPEKKEIKQNLLTKLTTLPTISAEQLNLLSQLNLTNEQFIAISQKAYRFTEEEKEWLKDNYSSLSIQQKLTLINAGLNNLGIDNWKKKEIFVDLNQQLHWEKNNFDLTIREKENILRLLINTLNLSQEQQSYLESMGVSFFNASNWHIDNVQKNHLLSFGINKVNLTAEQKKNLIDYGNLKTFSLTEDQKTILQSLAPLIKEHKYSNDSLELLKSLDLKYSSVNFLVNEEIIPNPNLDFGETPSPYLPLKLKFLLGEQKILEKQKELTEQEQQKEEIRHKKLSILNSLLEFAHKNQEENKNPLSDYADNNLYSLLDNEEDQEELHQLNYLLAEWVKIEVLKEWQVDILLILGLKTIPEYNFFELLKVASEINNQSLTEILEDSDLEEEYQKYLITPKNKPIFNWGKTVTELQGTSNNNSSFDLNHLESLINQKIDNALSGYQLRDPEETDNIPQLTPEPTQTNETSQPTPQTSRYDDLLTNLSTEENERLRKKKEREEAKKKLEEEELKRRKSKLSEKDRKLQEAEEQRQKEKELAEKEAEAREKARLAREKTLQEEQDNLFQQKMKNITEAKKRAEENLTNQKKQNELEEQKKRDEITKLEQENQQEQERLTKQAQLIEEEKIKKLESIALEDKEERLKIEKKFNEEKARIQSEADKKKRENEEELKKKENTLLAEKLAKEEEIRKMKSETGKLEQHAREMAEKFEQEKTARRELEEKRKKDLELNVARSDAERASYNKRERNANTALDSIYYYPMLKEEWDRCTQNGSHFDTCPMVKYGFERYPNLRVNPSLFQFDSGKWTREGSFETWTYHLANDLRKAVALCGNRWFTKTELENYIKENVPENW